MVGGASAPKSVMSFLENCRSRSKFPVRPVLVDYGAIGTGGKSFCHRIHGGFPGGHLHHSAVAIGVNVSATGRLIGGEFELRASFGNDEFVDGKGFDLEVGFELEAIDEERKQHLA